jgi:ribosomal protein L39E
MYIGLFHCELLLDKEKRRKKTLARAEKSATREGVFLQGKRQESSESNANRRPALPTD